MLAEWYLRIKSRIDAWKLIIEEWKQKIEVEEIEIVDWDLTIHIWNWFQ